MRTLLLLFAASALTVCAAAQEYPLVVDEFFAEIELRENATMRVTETIRVTFNARRRGIFRVIPVDLPGKYDVVARRVMIDVVSVTEPNGAPYTTKITRDGPNLRIRIGEEDVWFPPGTEKTYVITYEAIGMINWFDEGAADWEPRAQLYWNVTGPDWEMPIMRSGFRVTFPDVPEDESVRLRVFAGPYGSPIQNTIDGRATGFYGRDTDTLLDLSSSSASGVRETPLMPGSNLTFVLDVPAHMIHRLSLAQRARLFLLPNIGFTIPIWVLLVMLFFWARHGRDPYGGPMVVQYEPPDGISGPEAGALIDERVDKRDIAAGIISLAVKGHLKMYTTEEKGLIFKRRSTELKLTYQDSEETLTSFETELRSLLKGVDGRITEKDMREKVAPHLDTLHRKLYRSLVDHGYYLRSPRKVRTAWIVGGLIALVPLGIIFIVLNPLGSPVPSVVGGAVGALLVILFGYLMPRRTKQGAVAHQNVRGFEEFIRRARGEELKWMIEKHPDMALYEAYLPHAVAFGLTQDWTEAFEDVLTEPPSWYRGPAGAPFHGHSFALDLWTMTESFAAAAGTPPRSSGASGGGSGFGGGGFSGGGFGGGGGGGW
ncbi:MAG: DUF2207 domain-containing protein [Armatimonadetes bacterium]|nr:DUF2207 domain-containing protein [Armatimonadota bacterium]